MSEPFIGEVRAVGFNFAPRGWALCAGQLMSIAQNTALFSLLGTTFGGDGMTKFGLPDYRGRSPVGMGNGPGLSAITQGQASGTETVTLLTAQMPSHNHTASGAQAASDASAMAPIPVTVQLSGGGNPVPIRNPFLGTNFIIALEGIFPSRP